MGCCTSSMIRANEPEDGPRTINRLDSKYLHTGEKLDTTYKLKDGQEKSRTPKARDKIVLSTDKSALVQVLKMGVALEEHLMKNGIRDKQVLVSCVDISAKESQGSKYFDYRWRLNKFRFVLESDVLAYIAIVTDRWLLKKATQIELALISEQKMLWQASNVMNTDGATFPVSIISLPLDNKGMGGEDAGGEVFKQKIMERSAGYNQNLLVLSSITNKWVRQDKSKRELGFAGLNKFKDPRFVVAGKYTVNVDPMNRGCRTDEKKSDDPDMLARELFHHLIFTTFRQVRLNKVFSERLKDELPDPRSERGKDYRSEAVRGLLKKVDVDEAHSEPEEVLTSRSRPQSGRAGTSPHIQASPGSPVIDGRSPRVGRKSEGSLNPTPRVQKGDSVATFVVDTASDPGSRGPVMPEGEAQKGDGEASTTSEDVAVPANMPHLYLNFAEAKKRGPGNNSPRVSRAGSRLASKERGRVEDELLSLRTPSRHAENDFSHELADANGIRFQVDPDPSDPPAPDPEHEDPPASSMKLVPQEDSMGLVQGRSGVSGASHGSTRQNAHSRSSSRQIEVGPHLAPGDRLVIHNLHSNAEYNGMFAKVLQVLDSNKMIEVVVPSMANERLYLNPDNLLPLEDPMALFPALRSPVMSRAASPKPRPIQKSTSAPGLSASTNKAAKKILDENFGIDPSSDEEDNEEFFVESDSDIDIPEQLLTEAVQRERDENRAFSENSAAGLTAQHEEQERRGLNAHEERKNAESPLGGHSVLEQSTKQMPIEEFLPPIYCPIDLEKLARQLPTSFGGNTPDGVGVMQPAGMPSLPPPRKVSPEPVEEGKLRETGGALGSNAAAGSTEGDPDVADMSIAQDPDLDGLESGNLMREQWVKKGPQAEQEGQQVPIPRELIQGSLDDTRMRRGAAAAQHHQTRVAPESGDDAFAANASGTNFSSVSAAGASATVDQQEPPTSALGLPSLAKMQTTEHMNRPMPFPQNGKLDMSQVVLLSDTVGNGLIGLLGGVGTGGGFVPTGGAFATIREEDEDGDPGIGDMTIGGSSGSGNRTKNGVSVDDADEDPDIGDAGIFPATKAEIAEAREKALETNVRMFEPISGEKIAAAPDTQGLNQTKGNGSDAGGGTVGEKNGVSQNRQSTSSGPGPALPDPNAESRSSTKSGSFSPPKAPAGVRPPSLSARPSSSSSPDGDSRRSSKRAPPFALDMRNVESGVDPRLKFLETLVGLVVRPHCKDLSTEDHKYPSSVIEPHTGKVRQFFSAFVDGSITRELPMSFEGEQFSWHRLSELRSSYLNKTVVVQDPRRDRNAAPDLSRRLDGDIGEILSGDSLKMVCWATDIRDREHKDDEVRQEIDTLLQDYQTLKNSLARNRADEIAAYYGYEFHPSYNCLYLYSEYIDGGTVWDRIALKRLSRRHEIMRAEIGISRDNIDPGILGLAEKEVQFITTRVVKGLEQLHYLGVFHGALRCSNIGINRRSGKVQLLDWGVSKLRTYCNDAAMSYTAWNCRWMAPELLNEGSGAPGAAFNISAMSKKSDLWSLGCCVLEMLMGAAPYSSVASVARATPQQTLYWLRSGEHVPPAPEKFTTAECRDFCQMCLVWDVENRVETGSDRFVCHPFRKPSFQARYEAPKPGSTSGTSAQSGTTQANNASNFQQQQQETGKSASAGGSKSSASPGAGPDSPAYNSRQFVTVRGSALPMDPREFFERQRQRGVKLPPTEKFDGAAPAKVAPDGKADAKPKKPRPPGAQLDPGMPRPTSFHNLRNNPRVAHRAGNSPSPPPLARVVA